MLGRRDTQIGIHGYAFAVLEQSNDQVIGHTLLVVGEQYVTTNGKVRFFHQLCQVFDSDGTELDEIAAIDKGL